MFSKDPDEEYIGNRRGASVYFFAQVTLLLSIFVGHIAANTAVIPEVLGTRLRMSHSDVKEVLQKSGAPMTETSPNLISIRHPPATEDVIEEIRFFFENDRLYKIAVFFQIPEQESSAANLLSLHGRLKDRLVKEYGSPIQCLDEMRVPAPEQRYEWIARGLAYHRCVWGATDQARITLWLYGEDTGIVLSTVYEALSRQ